jgi:hypothetical protein
MPANDNVVMENVRLVFRNFTGREGQFNAEGQRSFGVILPDDVAERMAADGWNVKTLKPREEDEDETETPWLPVKLGYGKGRPPVIVLITDRGRTNLDESKVDMLDWVDIRQDDQGRSMVDLIVRPYHYNVRGDTGIAAYLQSLYITIDEDPLAAKYGDLPTQ